VDDSVALPMSWDIESRKNVRWRIPVPGLAHASPIAWGDRVYVATAVGPGGSELKVGLYGDIAAAKDQEKHEWRLFALELASGRVIWNSLGHEGVPKVKRHTKASHCNSTPATDGRRIVTLFGSEGLFCFDMEGRLVWKKDLGPMDSGFFRIPTAQWGFASSPVIHEGKVLVQCDVQTNSFLAAFDLESGNEIWRAERRDVPTWSTPLVFGKGSESQIVVNGWKHAGGYDAASGREIWKLREGGDIPVPTPIEAHGLIWLTSDHGRFRPIRAVRRGATGDITPPEMTQTNAAIAWVHPRRGNYMQTPIAVGDLLFACTDSGVLTCFDARSGAVEYEERLGGGGQGFTASPVSDGRRLYFASELGNVHVVPVSASFSVQATNALGETCLATPAISRGTLLFRTREHLVAVGEKDGDGAGTSR
jgi:outer membrane protein assembly factor BamB